MHNQLICMYQKCPICSAEELVCDILFIVYDIFELCFEVIEK